MNTELIAARAEVNKYAFGTPEWESAMEVVRAITRAEAEAFEADVKAGRKEHFSIDSGFHRTMLLDGRIIGRAD